MVVILSKVESVWIKDLEDKMMRYFNFTVFNMIKHLWARGGAVKNHDKETMMHEQDCQCATTEFVVSYFSWVKKAMKQLITAGISSDNNEHHDCALIIFKKSHNFEKISDTWDQKPPVDHDWDELKNLFPPNMPSWKMTEWSTNVTGFGITANTTKVMLSIKAYAIVTSEILATVTQFTNKKLEVFMVSNTKLMEQLVIFLKQNTTNNSTTRNIPSHGNKDGQVLLGNAATTVDASIKGDDNKCWELEENAASCNKGLKLCKKDWQCGGSDVNTEIQEYVWQQGKVLFNK